MVTIAGSVSAQASAGEVVTVTITKPDGTKEAPVTTKTDLNGLYSVNYTPSITGVYPYDINIDKDLKYMAAVFHGNFEYLLPRTITATVT